MIKKFNFRTGNFEEDNSEIELSQEERYLLQHGPMRGRPFDQGNLAIRGLVNDSHRRYNELMEKLDKNKKDEDDGFYTRPIFPTK